MDFLELQLSEPIPFRFHSLLVSSTGGPLLTFIAVLAAAMVGFWRIRIGGSKDDESDDCSPLSTASSESEEERAQQKAVPLVQSTETETSLSPSCFIDRPVEIVGTPKIRFTTYFEEEDFIGCCHVQDEEEELIPEIVGEEFCQREPLERENPEVKWESMLIRRRGDLGWYCYQDMAALNGSVVRLWDGESPRRRKGSIAISTF